MQTDYLIGMIVGTVAVKEFFSSENVRQIVAGVYRGFQLALAKAIFGVRRLVAAFQQRQSTAVTRSPHSIGHTQLKTAISHH